MRVRARLTSCCAATALLMGAGQAVAADLPPEPPILVPPPVVEVAEPSCLYVRVDGGYAWHEEPEVTKNHGIAFGEQDDETWFVEAGVGCQVTPYFRADLTVGYRDDIQLETKFNDLDAQLESYTAMVNGYWDIVNVNGFTPYVGAGIGVAYNNLHDINLPVNQSSNGRADFAYQLMAGVSYDFSPNLTVDAGYRYIDLGKAKAKGPDPIKVTNLESHDFRIGLRYNFNDY